MITLVRGKGLLNAIVIKPVSGKEAWDLCVENDEEKKYLMTFQNFLSRVPKWNQSIIEEETKYYASLTAELKYQDEVRASALIRNYIEQNGIDEKAQAINHFEATFRNIDESELIEELESYGFSFVEFDRIENTHYVLMSFNKEKLNSVN